MLHLNLLNSFRWGLHYVNVVVNGKCEYVSPADKILDLAYTVDLVYTDYKINAQWDEFHSIAPP